MEQIDNSGWDGLSDDCEDKPNKIFEVFPMYDDHKIKGKVVRGNPLVFTSCCASRVNNACYSFWKPYLAECVGFLIFDITHKTN